MDQFKDFEWGYLSAQKDMCGTMTPFRPMWWAQYLGDGTQEWFDTKSECIAWMRDW
jgi:hypothetical protein